MSEQASIARPTVKTAGRTDVADYFRLHVGYGRGKLSHSPLLVFRQAADGIVVDIVSKPADLLTLPDETPVMGIWPGQWSSNYFQFTVGDYRQFLSSKEPS